VAQRLIERERSLTNSNVALGDPQRQVRQERSRGRAAVAAVPSGRSCSASLPGWQGW